MPARAVPPTATLTPSHSPRLPVGAVAIPPRYPPTRRLCSEWTGIDTVSPPTRLPVGAVFFPLPHPPTPSRQSRRSRHSFTAHAATRDALSPPPRPNGCHRRESTSLPPYDLSSTPVICPHLVTTVGDQSGELELYTHVPPSSPPHAHTFATPEPTSPAPSAPASSPHACTGATVGTVGRYGARARRPARHGRYRRGAAGRRGRRGGGGWLHLRCRAGLSCREVRSAVGGSGTGFVHE
eukprot:scaffold15689_cov135-Isochrysis_galbana.AAC.7